jgi:hypothetical protein
MVCWIPLLMAKFELQPGSVEWPEPTVSAAYVALIDGLTFGFATPEKEKDWVPIVLDSYQSPFIRQTLQTVYQMQRSGQAHRTASGEADTVIGNAIRAYEYSGLRINAGIVTMAATVAGYDQDQLRTLLLPTDTLLREIPGATDDVRRYKHYRRLGTEALFDMGFERMAEDEKYLPITQP